MFDGNTFDPSLDSSRLASQLESVKRLMRDGRWRTLEAIHILVGGSEAGISARLRDLRKPRFGGHVVERRRLDNGLHEYRVRPPAPSGQATLFPAPDVVPERWR